MSSVTCTIEPLPEARAKLSFVVAPDEVETRIGEAAEKLSTEVKMPGFREGKVPSDLVVQKLGREAVFQQAFEDSITAWYSEALRDADIAPIGSPELAAPLELPEGDAPLEFEFEVAVRPEATLPEYEGIEIGRGEPVYDDAVIEQELATIQERFAKLVAVERSAEPGNFVQIDFVGRVDGEAFEGGSAKEFVLEIGSQRFIEGFEEQLVGAKAGDELKVSVIFPPDYGNAELSGKSAEFEVTVHEVKEKEIGELTDEFAQENLGYENVGELRKDIEQRMREQADAEVEREYRWAVVDAVAAKAEMTVPKGHIHSRAHELWHEMAMSLSQRGMDPRAYVQAMGKSEHEFIDELEPDAIKTIRREAVIAAVIEQQNFEITDEDLIQAMIDGDESQRAAADEQLAKIKDAGRVGQFKMDVSGRKAVEFLASKATPIAKDLAEARDAMWTPEKGAEETAEQTGGDAKGGLWTPGS